MGTHGRARVARFWSIISGRAALRGLDSKHRSSGAARDPNAGRPSVANGIHSGAVRLPGSRMPGRHRRTRQPTGDRSADHQACVGPHARSSPPKQPNRNTRVNSNGSRVVRASSSVKAYSALNSGPRSRLVAGRAGSEASADASGLPTRGRRRRGPDQPRWRQEPTRSHPSRAEPGSGAPRGPKKCPAETDRTDGYDPSAPPATDPAVDGRCGCRAPSDCIIALAVGSSV